MKKTIFEQNVVLRAFGTNLGVIFSHLGSQKGLQEEPQTESKTIKKETKDQHEIWMRPGGSFPSPTGLTPISDPSSLGRPGPQEVTPGSPGNAPQAPRG